MMSLIAGSVQVAVELQIWTLTFLLHCLHRHINGLLQAAARKRVMWNLDNLRYLIGRLHDLSVAIDSCYGFTMLIFLVSRSVFCQYHCYKVINFLYHTLCGTVSKAVDTNVLSTARKLIGQVVRICIQIYTCNAVVTEVS
jgi:hypothetical protein